MAQGSTGACQVFLRHGKELFVFFVRVSCISPDKQSITAPHSDGPNDIKWVHQFFNHSFTPIKFEEKIQRGTFLSRMVELLLKNNDQNVIENWPQTTVLELKTLCTLTTTSNCEHQLGGLVVHSLEEAKAKIG